MFPDFKTFTEAITNFFNSDGVVAIIGFFSLLLTHFSKKSEDMDDDDKEPLDDMDKNNDEFKRALIERMRGLQEVQDVALDSIKTLNANVSITNDRMKNMSVRLSNIEDDLNKIKAEVKAQKEKINGAERKDGQDRHDQKDV